MKQLLNIILTVCTFNSFAQNKVTFNNFNEKELYSFMQMVITQRNLNKTFGFSIEPDTSFAPFKLDYSLLSEYLFDTIAIRRKLEFDSIEQQKSIYEAPNLYQYFEDERKCLTEKDIQSFLQNKKTYLDFKWRNSEFGFDLNNKNERYSFTLPVFNSEKTMALICISYSCNLFMCGKGDIVLFKIENNQWTNVTLKHWVH